MYKRRILAAAVCFTSVAVGFAACGGGESQPAGPDASVEAGGSALADIGPGGGSISACGSVLAVPPGSLTATQTITLSCSPAATVAGFTLLSPLYRFEPEGLTFAQPVTVTLAFAGAGASTPSLYWSRPDGSGYDPIASSVQGAFVVGAVTHFSTGFVGVPAGPPAGDASSDAALDAGADGPPFQCTTPSDPPTVGVPCGAATCTGDAGVCNHAPFPLPADTPCETQGLPQTNLAEACDGPEDCPAGQACFAYRPGDPSIGTFCGSAPTLPGAPGIGLVVCHSSSDCPPDAPVCGAPTPWFDSATVSLRTCTKPCSVDLDCAGRVGDNPQYRDAGTFWIGANCYADPGCDPTCHVQAQPVDAGSLVDGALPDGCVTPYPPRGYIACTGTGPAAPGPVTLCNAQFQRCALCGCLCPTCNCPVNGAATVCDGPEDCAPGQYCETVAGCIAADAGDPGANGAGVSPYLCHADVDCPPNYPFCYLSDSNDYGYSAKLNGVLSGNCNRYPPPPDAGVVYGSCGNALNEMPPNFGVPCGATTCTSPDELCCQAGVTSGSSVGTFACVPRSAGCGGANAIQCDGPEDCITGTQCGLGVPIGPGPPLWAFCSGEPTWGPLCHTPADCPASAPYCWPVSGNWTMDGLPSPGLGSYPISLCSSSDAGL
jgi:hypothetical protein